MSFILLIKSNNFQWNQCELIEAEECTEGQLPEGFQKLLPDQEEYLSILERIHAPDYLLESEKMALGSILENSFFYFRMTVVTDYCRIYLTKKIASLPGTDPFLGKKSKHAKAFNANASPSDEWIDSQDWLFTNIARFFGQQPRILDAMLNGSLLYERCSFDDAPSLNTIPLVNYSPTEGLHIWKRYKRHNFIQLLEGFAVLGLGIGIGMLSAAPVLLPFMLFGVTSSNPANCDGVLPQVPPPDNSMMPSSSDNDIATVEHLFANILASQDFVSNPDNENLPFPAARLLANPARQKDEILREIKESNDDLVFALIRMKFDFNSLHTQDSDSSPLYSLFKKEDYGLALLLLKRGNIDPNYEFEKGPVLTLIVLDQSISIERKMEICLHLMSNNARTNIQDYRKNPLVMAVINHHLPLVNLFISSGELGITDQFHLLHFSLQFGLNSVTKFLIHDYRFNMNEQLALDSGIPEQRIPVMGLVYNQKPLTMTHLIEAGQLSIKTVEHYSMLLFKKAFERHNHALALELSNLLIFQYDKNKVWIDLMTLSQQHPHLAENIDFFIKGHKELQSHHKELFFNGFSTLFLLACVTAIIVATRKKQQDNAKKEIVFCQKIHKEKQNSQITQKKKPLAKPVVEKHRDNGSKSIEKILNEKHLDTILLYQKTIKRLKEKDFSNEFAAIDQIQLPHNNYIEESRTIFTNYRNKIEKDNLVTMNNFEATLQQMQKLVAMNPEASLDMRVLDKIQLELEAITTDQAHITKRIEDTYKHIPKKEKIKTSKEAKKEAAKPVKKNEFKSKPETKHPKLQKPVTVIPSNPVNTAMSDLMRPPGFQLKIPEKQIFFEKVEKTCPKKLQQNQIIKKDKRIFYIIHLMHLMENLDKKYKKKNTQDPLRLEKLNDAAFQLISKAADITYGLFLNYPSLKESFPQWKELLALRNNILHQPKLLQQTDLHQFLQDFLKTFYVAFNDLKNHGNFARSITNEHFHDLRLFGKHQEESLTGISYGSVIQKLVALCYKMNRYYQTASTAFDQGKLGFDGILHASMASCFLQWRALYNELHHLWVSLPESVDSSLFFNIKKACRDLLIIPGFKDAKELGNQIAHTTTDYNQRITVECNGYQFLVTSPNEYYEEGKILYVQEAIPYLSLFKHMGEANDKTIPAILKLLEQPPLKTINHFMPDISMD